MDQEILSILMSNMRIADQRIGDIKAQAAALTTGEQRLTALIDRYGAGVVKQAIAEMRHRAERQMRAKIAAIPDGVYEGSSQVDSDGVVDEPLAEVYADVIFHRASWALRTALEKLMLEGYEFQSDFMKNLVAKAQADGYTVLIAANPYVIVPSQYLKPFPCTKLIQSIIPLRYLRAFRCIIPLRLQKILRHEQESVMLVSAHLGQQVPGAAQAFTIQSSGGLQKASAYRPIIVAWRNGSPVRLEELGTILDGVEDLARLDDLLELVDVAAHARGAGAERVANEGHRRANARVWRARHARDGRIRPAALDLQPRELVRLAHLHDVHELELAVGAVEEVVLVVVDLVRRVGVLPIILAF